MSFSVEIELDVASARDRLSRAHDRIPQWRRALVERVAREALARTIPANPVDTARSRSAWVAALEQLGGAPPPGWQGAQPDAAAIAEGRDLGSVARSESSDVTDIQITSGVDYVTYLEYGTRRMSPFAMAHRGLYEVRALLPALAPALFAAHLPD